MKKKITATLTKSPSYLRWSTSRLSSYFGCSERTMKGIKNSLEEARTNYETSLKSKPRAV